MSIRELLEIGISVLKQNSVENPIQHARILLAHIIGKSKEYLIAHDNEIINKDTENEYKKAIYKLVEGIPIQYITNSQQFMKLDFFVNESVLIPRADTEILVEEVIGIAKKEKKFKILDLCTGSGAIGISLDKYIENAEIICSDISKKAIDVANKNRDRNNSKVKIIQSNMFESIKDKFDIIVSNPPYIRDDIIKTLEKNVLCEPYMALSGGNDGLKFYRIIAENGYKFLDKNGYICLEIGYDQKESVINIFKEYEQYKEIYSKKDLNNLDRIVVIRKG